ncbi:hypothetical protein N1F78_07225 [Seonamhaeicola sp. MEBiC1930]|uniref:hypothetical protein n=1 Tax=Seonamhaeicola sp. MEBiC01930 TaxID=2976768 RepID=UPI00325685D7
MKKLVLLKSLCIILVLALNSITAQNSADTNLIQFLESKEDTNDIFYGSSVINFNNPLALTAADLSNVQSGEKVVYSNAVLFQDRYYDIVLTILSINGAFTIDCNNELRVNTFDSSKDNYVTYSFDLVETGSAIPSNPLGEPAVLYDVILESRDIDTRSFRDFTEVSGVNPYTVTSKVKVNLSGTTNLENAGFANGPDPSGFTLYRLNPGLVGANTDWVDEPHDGETHGDNPDFSVYMEFDQFSHVDLLYGATGTEAHTWVRLTNFGMSAKSSFNKKSVAKMDKENYTIGYNTNKN